MTIEYCWKERPDVPITKSESTYPPHIGTTVFISNREYFVVDVVYEIEYGSTKVIVVLEKVSITHHLA